MPTLLVCSATDDLRSVQSALRSVASKEMPGLTVTLWPEPFDPQDVIGVAAWHPPASLLRQLPHVKLIASIGAGTEHILRCPDLPHGVPVTRVADAGQAIGMAEYLLWTALHFHRDMDQMLAQQSQSLWRMPVQRAAAQFRIGIMGLGLMGQAAAVRLRGNGFVVSGWARNHHAIDGISTFAGNAELDSFLAPLDMVICLLPLTPATRAIGDVQFLAKLKPGAVLVNVGRGEHVVIPDLLAALDRGHLRAAVLDVFDSEPLSQGDPLWRHPRVIITPHMASSASETTIASQIIGDVLRVQQGLNPAHTIDLALGY
jgi:glyoxylate/hydroxypyruvate reductase A